MSTKKPAGRYLYGTLRQMFGRPSRKSTRAVFHPRRLATESLEDRRLLANDLGAVEGVVFDDLNDNGVFESATESRLAGVTVQISGGTLTSPMTDVSDVNGVYRFDGLGAGTYSVQQLPPPPTGFSPRPGSSPQTVVITSLEAMGRAGTLVDNFDGVEQETTAASPATVANPNPNFSTTPDPNAIGGTRDLIVQSVTTPGQASIFSDIPGNPGVLSFDPLNNTRGRYQVVWDGDLDPNTLMATGGLNGGAGFDLTDGGASDRFQLALGIQGTGQTMTIRIFTNSNRVSEETFIFPNSLAPDQEVILPISAFSQSNLPGVIGVADFTEVRAVEIDHTATVLAADASMDLVAMLGPSVETVNFANISPVDVSVTKSVSNDSPNVGDPVVFTVTATNLGPGTATGVLLQDVIPAGMTYLGDSPSQGNYLPNSGIWDIGTLTNDSSVSLQLTASVDTVGTKTNIASLLELNEIDSNSANNSATAMVTPQSVDLRVTKNVNDSTPNLNDEVFFTVTVTNQGPSTATGVQVEDNLPDGMTYVSDNSTLGGYSPLTGIWTVGTLGDGDGATLTIRAAVDTVGIKINTAQLFSVNERDRDPTNNLDTASLTPSSLDLVVSKTVSDSAPNLGQPVTFGVTVRNDGPVTATGVQLRDVLPAGMSLISSNATDGQYSPGTGIWFVGTLANGSQATLSLNATVDTMGKKTNTATLIDVDQTDTNSANNEAMAMLTPEIVGINVVKRVNGADANTPETAVPVFVGELIGYTFDVTNTGNVPLANVSVSDDNATPETTIDDFMANFMSGDADSNGLLDLNETWEFAATTTARSGFQVNTATASGRSPSQDVVFDTDPAQYLGMDLPELPTKRRFLASSGSIYRILSEVDEPEFNL